MERQEHEPESVENKGLLLPQGPSTDHSLGVLEGNPPLSLKGQDGGELVRRLIPPPRQSADSIVGLSTMTLGESLPRISLRLISLPTPYGRGLPSWGAGSGVYTETSRCSVYAWDTEPHGLGPDPTLSTRRL